MLVRKGKKTDFNRLEWGWCKDYPTKRMFVKRLEEGWHEFWVVEEKKREQLLGEFHIMWDSPDKDEADGKKRAYLCVFRVHPEHRGKGIGKALKERVFLRTEERKIKELTIGVKKDAPDIRKMYYRWGFRELLKKKYVDHHNINEKGNYTELNVPIELYLKK